jgi:alkylation response protein AidB-like acyl-CoA dehydrogenase
MAGYIVDEAVQIHGGYGYIHEYPVERAYRDLRISRVVEGTNEINRLLIVDMLVKRAMKNRLPVLDAAQKVANELPTLKLRVPVDDGRLGMQQEMVEVAKKIALLVTGAAVQKCMMQLPEEQEIMGLLSDMAIEVFAMESGLLRALKKMAKSTDEKAQIQKAMVKVYVNAAFGRVGSYARQVFAAIAEGDALKQHLAALDKITAFTPINTIALRREVAHYTIKLGRYPF